MATTMHGTTDGELCSPKEGVRRPKPSCLHPNLSAQTSHAIKEDLQVMRPQRVSSDINLS